MDLDEMTPGLKLFSIPVPFFLSKKTRAGCVLFISYIVLSKAEQIGCSKMPIQSHPYLMSSLMPDLVHVIDISDKHSFVIN